MSDQARTRTEGVREPRSGGHGLANSVLSSGADAALHPLLQLQQIIGNRAVQRRLNAGPTAIGLPVIQRRALAPRQIAGQNLGTLRLVQEGEPIPMTATTEVVTTGDQAGRFMGFATYYEALSLALLQSGITAIVTDSASKFHVLNVSENAPIAFETRSEPRRAGLGWCSVRRFVNPAIPEHPSVTYGELDPDTIPPERDVYTWAGRVRQARLARTRCQSAPAAAERTRLWGPVVEAFTGLAMEAFQVSRDAVRVQRLTGHEVAGKINIIVLDTGMEAGGYAGPGDAPSARRSAASEPGGHIALRWSLFTEDGPENARRVLRHEAVHYGGRERTIQLMQIWQRTVDSRSVRRPNDAFLSWLQLPETQRQHGVTDYDIRYAYQQIFRRSSAMSDEPLAAATEFTAVYHRIPADEIGPDDRSSPTFGPMNYMLCHWHQGVQASGGVTSMRDEAMRRLRVYYQTELDAAHRTAFDTWVDVRLAHAQSNPDAPLNPQVRGSATYSGYRSDSPQDERVRTDAHGVQAAFRQLQRFRRLRIGRRRR